MSTYGKPKKRRAGKGFFVEKADRDNFVVLLEKNAEKYEKMWTFILKYIRLQNIISGWKQTL